MMNVSKPINRILIVLLSVALGGGASMAALRVFHEWAFRTEFNWWLWMTAVHSCVVFVLFALSVAISPNIISAKNIAKCFAAVGLGGLSAVFVTPYGFVLVITGQAFITSGVAALVYVVVAALETRSALEHGREV